MRIKRSVISSLSLLLLLTLAPSDARARQTQNHTSPVPVIPGMSDGGVPPGSDPLMRRMNEKMAIERNDQRQKKIVSDSARLLLLAQMLNSDVAKSGKDELSVSVVKEATEIEKLAKSIKDRMRYGY